jgi:hypothetical protein
MATCGICDGRGSLAVKRQDKTPDGSMRAVLEEVPCTNCDGTGKISDDRSESDMKLTAGMRRQLPSSDFALPGQGEGAEGKGPGSYPIPNRSHAVNALSRSSGKPEASAVRAAVKRKFPSIGRKILKGK